MDPERAGLWCENEPGVSVALVRELIWCEHGCGVSMALV